MKTIRKLFLILLLIVLIVLIPFVGLGFANYVKTANEVSISEKIEGIKHKKSYVTYDKISEELLQATVAIEDRRFYEHHRMGYRFMAGALYQSVLTGQIRGEGSTIMQQLAKNIYYTYQPSYLRKVSEVSTAYDLERELSKKEILELCVNVINHGDNYIGIKAASEGYFRKELRNLTPGEATLLVGLPQSPANYQLNDHEPAVRDRQTQILNAMIRKNTIDEQQKATVMKQVEK